MGQCSKALFVIISYTARDSFVWIELNYYRSDCQLDIAGYLHKNNQLGIFDSAQPA